MAAADPHLVRRPSPWLFAAEVPRAVGELAWLQAARPALAGAPRGDGHTVVVLPGMGADDRSTASLRRFLSRLGYQVHGWGLGTNLPGRDVPRRLRERLDQLRARHPEPTSLVGWSLGGIYARQVARRAPEAVRLVVTLGSPFRSLPGYEGRAAPLIRAAALRRGDDVPRTWPRGDDRPLPVPSTSVLSRSDGVVPWRACINPRAPRHETLEVIGSHCGLGHHPAVLHVVADRLAQDPGAWQPLHVPAVWRPLLRHHADGATAGPGTGTGDGAG
jgi:pimeloyl-ACP methyl ester carboxylesterase